MNEEGSLNWDACIDKANKELGSNLKMSDTDNPIQWTKQFGPKIYFQRFHKRGATIIIKSAHSQMDYKPGDPQSKLEELMSFFKSLAPNERKIIITPKADGHSTAPTQVVRRPRQDTDISDKIQNIWIITGTKENMVLGLRHGVWGVKAKHGELWDKLKTNDKVFFYCTNPIGGIIGNGIVTGKNIDTKPFWSNENPDKESIYPLRIQFQVVAQANDWSKDKKSLYCKGIDFSHGINYVEPHNHNKLN